MLLISPTIICSLRGLLFIIRCLQTLGRLLATTREPSLGPEPMVKMNPGIPGDPCPVPLNSLVFRAADVGNLILSELDVVAADGLCLP